MASWTDQSASEHSWLYEAAKGGDDYAQHPAAPSALPPPNYNREAPSSRWWAIALAALLALGSAAMVLVTLSPPANAGLIACALGHVPPAHVTVCLSLHGDAFFASSGFVESKNPGLDNTALSDGLDSAASMVGGAVAGLIDRALPSPSAVADPDRADGSPSPTARPRRDRRQDLGALAASALGNPTVAGAASKVLANPAATDAAKAVAGDPSPDPLAAIGSAVVSAINAFIEGVVEPKVNAPIVAMRAIVMTCAVFAIILAIALPVIYAVRRAPSLPSMILLGIAAGFMWILLVASTVFAIVMAVDLNGGIEHVEAPIYGPVVPLLLGASFSLLGALLLATHAWAWPVQHYVFCLCCCRRDRGPGTTYDWANGSG